MPKHTLSKIAAFIGAELKGDPDCLIESIAALEQAGPQQLSFLDNPRYKKFLPHTRASAVIVSSADASDCAVSALIMANPYLGYAKAASLFEKKMSHQAGIDVSAKIGTNTKIDPSASVGAYCVIGNNVKIAAAVVVGAGTVIGDDVSIGKETQIASRVSIYHDVKIGERVIVHSGVVIGSDGFGFANDKGIWHKIPQLGGVRIGNDVEIGANTTIDRGALQETIIEDDVKLDNQIQIGHNVHIGAHTAVAGCVGIAGSTTIGKYCLIGGGTGIGGHLNITDKVIITGMSRVTHSITEPGMYSSGSPIQESADWRKNSVRMRQLDDMARRLQQLEKEVKR